jgi:hypothetical protein
VALGDSWISPVDYVLSWAPFLKAWSLLGDVAQANVSNLALRTQQAVGNGNLTGATALWAEVEGTISNFTDNVVWPPFLPFACAFRACQVPPISPTEWCGPLSAFRLCLPCLPGASNFTNNVVWPSFLWF